MKTHSSSEIEDLPSNTSYIKIKSPLWKKHHIIFYHFFFFFLVDYRRPPATPHLFMFHFSFALFPITLLFLLVNCWGFFLESNSIPVAQCFLNVLCGQAWITNFLHRVCKIVLQTDARYISQGLTGLE